MSQQETDQDELKTNGCSVTASAEAPESRFPRIIAEFLNGRGCPMPMGPAYAIFATLQQGGAQTIHYCYGVLTEGGWMPAYAPRGPDGCAYHGRGCSTYEELERTFLSLLDQHTKPGFPVVVRSGPEVKRAEDGRWLGYFRFVQLDFKARSMLIDWSLT